MIYTADDLLVSVKTGVSIPTSQGRFSNDNILALADEYISSELVPELMNVNVDYLIAKETITANGDEEYSIPYRAIGRIIREIRFDSTVLKEIDINDFFSTSGSSVNIAFSGDKFLPFPTPTSGSFELRYPRRPSALIQTTAAGKVVGINAISKIIQVDTVPTGLVSGDLIDVINAKSGNQIKEQDLAVTIDGTNLELSVDIPDCVTLGDYICPAEKSCVIQLPAELFVVVSLAVQCAILDAQSDIEALAAKQAKLQSAKKNALSLLSPRLLGASKTVSPSPLMTYIPQNWRRRAWLK